MVLNNLKMILEPNFKIKFNFFGDFDDSGTNTPIFLTG